MNKEKLSIIYWCLFLSSNGFLTPENERHRTRDQMMQTAGYPKPGDIPLLNRKVFKGQRVSIREHPYVASIRRLTSHYITGALTSRNTVLTVAHPLFNVSVKDLNVVLGENYSDRGTILLTVILVILHHDFDLFTLRNDIAMIRVYEHTNYKMNLKPIVLMGPQQSLTGKKAFVTGWGRCDNMGNELCLDRTSKFYPDEKLDPMLRTVTFTINSPEFYCDGYTKHDVTLHPGMLCCGVAREVDQVASCLAVPGAPLVVHARLAGLLSWGFGCGYSYDMPLVYSDIKHFVPWIVHNNRVLYQLKQTNFSLLFQATKAAVLSKWLIESRVVRPNETNRSDRSLEPLDIDYQLINLRGIVYDVRDFVNGGVYSTDKKQMYESLRNEQMKLLATTSSYTRPQVISKPFISNSTLREAGLFIN